MRSRGSRQSRKPPNKQGGVAHYQSCQAWFCFALRAVGCQNIPAKACSDSHQRAQRVTSSGVRLKRSMELTSADASFTSHSTTEKHPSAAAKCLGQVGRLRVTSVSIHTLHTEHIHASKHRMAWPEPPPNICSFCDDLEVFYWLLTNFVLKRLRKFIQH